ERRETAVSARSALPVPAPVFEALSPGQVFVAGSWASWGIGFQLQRSTPVRVSNARTTPLGTSTRSLSEILEPTITKSSMIAGGEVSSYSPSRRMFLIPWRRLIWPAVAKSPHGLPVAASKQIKRASMVAINMRRLDRLVGLLSGPVVENVIELPQKILAEDAVDLSSSQGRCRKRQHIQETHSSGTQVNSLNPEAGNHAISGRSHQTLGLQEDPSEPLDQVRMNQRDVRPSALTFPHCWIRDSAVMIHALDKLRFHK